MTVTAAERHVGLYTNGKIALLATTEGFTTRVASLEKARVHLNQVLR